MNRNLSSRDDQSQKVSVKCFDLIFNFYPKCFEMSKVNNCNNIWPGNCGQKLRKNSVSLFIKK